MLWPYHRSVRPAFGNGVQVNLLHVAWEKVLAGGLPRIEVIAFEIRLALRGLRRHGSYALASIGMLTVALALNTTVFTVMDVMLFRGAPGVNRSDRVVYFQERCAGSPCGLSYADVAEWRDHARSLTAISFVGTRLISLRDADGRQADLSTRIVSANTFRLLGVAPLLGRDFTDDDEAEGAQPTAILSHRFWTQQYGASTSAIGSAVQIDGAPTVIIGVMPERFEFPSETSMWMPVTRTRELLNRGATAGSHVAVGRLQDGVTLPAALAELEAINSRLALIYPDTNRGRVPVGFTYAQFISGPDAPLMWRSLWAGSWFVVLIACANLANLTLVRTTGRWREFATTMALGAGQARMIRGIAIESTLLTAVAAPVAWWLTTWSVRAWSIATASRYQVLDYTVDAGMLAYLLAVAAIATVLFSMAPIARLHQLSVSGVFNAQARGTTQSPWHRHLSSGLVAMQMALAIVLLAGAGILMRSITNIIGAESGVREPQQVLVGMLRMPSLKYPDTTRRLAYLERVRSELDSLPGIEAQTVSSGIPVKFSGRRRTFEIDARAANPDEDLAVLSVTAGTEYFRVLGALPVSGRAFNRDDHAAGAAVAIVNQSFAARFWPGESPVGKRLRFTDGGAAGDWRTVVGVVPNIMEGDALRQEFKPVVYTPFLQEAPARAVFFLVRTAADSASAAPAIRSRLQSLDADVTLDSFGALQDHFAFDRDSMDFEHSELGKHATIAPIFATIALLLAAVGVVAVIAHSISQRTKEIGIRMAIGASAQDVSRMLLAEGMRPVFAGLVVGLAVTLAANRILQSQLVGVSPFDPLVMFAAPAVLVTVALAACAIPIRRALSIEPLIALRHD
jgi:predicted permease